MFILGEIIVSFIELIAYSFVDTSLEERQERKRKKQERKSDRKAKKKSKQHK